MTMKHGLGFEAQDVRFRFQGLATVLLAQGIQGIRFPGVSIERTLCCLLLGALACSGFRP